MSRNPIAEYFLSQVEPPELPANPETFTNADLRGARFVDSDLSGSTFQEVGLRYARLRGADLVNAEIWGAISGLMINGVEVAPLIEAELDRRYPGRATLFDESSNGVRAAWRTVEDVWAATVERASRLPEEDLHTRLHGEWSFLETLRHLVMVDDGFLRQVRDRERPIYRHGVPHTPVRSGFASVIDLDADPPSDEVFAARAGRMAEVRELLAGIDAEELRRMCEQAPFDLTGMAMPVRYCFWRMVNEEWEHHSFALRDLEVLESAHADG